jgi:uncharacterized RDD family membrane protein YckC
VTPEIAARAPTQDHSAPCAGFWVRFDALSIDLILLSVAGGVFLGIDPMEPSPPSLVEGIVGAVVLLAYFTYFEGSASGQTIGKKLMNIRVIDAYTKESIGFSRALLRNVVGYFVSPVLFLGYLWMLWDDDGQTWHDKVAASLVVPTVDYPVARWPG